MNETELERLVVRLVGDMSQFVQTMKDAQAHTEKSSKGMQSALEAVGTAMAALEVKHFLESSLHAWEEQEEAIIRTEAILRANGREVDDLSKDYQKFSSQMQEVTTQADEVTLALLGQAESYGVTRKAAKEAVQDAMAIATINKTSAESIIALTAAVKQGDMERAMKLSRRVLQLRGVKDEEEFMDRYKKLVEAGTEAEHKLAETGGGRMKQFHNDLGDLKEQIGELTARIVGPLAQAGSALAKWAQGLPEWLKAGVVGLSSIGIGLATIAVVGPHVVHAIGAVITAVKALTVATIALGRAALTNPFVWIAVAAAGVIYLAGRITGLWHEWQRLNQELEKSAELNRDLARVWERRVSAFLAGIDNLSADDKIKAMTDKIKEWEKELEHARKRAEDAQKWLDDNWWLGDPDRVDIEKQNLKEANEAAERWKANIERLKDEIQALEDAAKRASKAKHELFQESASFGSTEAWKRLYGMYADQYDKLNKLRAGKAGDLVPGNALPEVLPGVGRGEGKGPFGGGIGRGAGGMENVPQPRTDIPQPAPIQFVPPGEMRGVGDKLDRIVDILLKTGLVVSMSSMNRG